MCTKLRNINSLMHKVPLIEHKFKITINAALILEIRDILFLRAMDNWAFQGYLEGAKTFLIPKSILSVPTG
jgi:hypothetical protein